MSKNEESIYQYLKEYFDNDDIHFEFDKIVLKESEKIIIDDQIHLYIYII